MRPDALIPLFGAIINFGLALFVLLQSPRSVVARVFFMLVTSFAIWNFGTFWMFRVQTAQQALFWARFLQFGVIWIPVTFLHLSFLIAGIALPKQALRAGYAIQVVMLLCNCTSLIVAGVRNVGYAWYTVGGPLYFAVFVFFALDWTSVLVLIRHRRHQPRLLQRRLTPLIVAQTAIAVFGSNDALPIVGIDYYPFTKLQIYPVGSMMVIVYGLIVAYGVLQHQLLNVHVVLGRFTATAVRMLFLFTIGFGLLLVVAVLTHHFDIIGFLSSLGVLVVSSLIASTVFPRLLGAASEDLERRLLGDRFEYQDQVRSFLNTMPQYTELPPLQEDLHQLLMRTFRLESYQLILREEVASSFFLLQAYPEEPSRPLPDFRLDSPVFAFFANGHRDYLTLGPEQLKFSSTALERRARLQLQPYGHDFCFPLMFQEEPLGLLLAGKKSSRDPFTATDVRLLSALARNLSQLVNQVRLKTQVNQAQELELLGRMSRGMAHDLNNLLTPVSTLLQLGEESGELDDELLPVAMRNLAAMRAYIREALFFSEHMRPDLQETALDHLVRQAIEVAVNSRSKEVRVRPEIPAQVLAELDGVLVQRLIANLITNAIDASPAGSEIVVRLERRGRLDEDREWLRVEIIDRGEGIPRENLNRIFTPYFTTKDRGDRDRGFGLGLAICRKIAVLHGGNLSIESQVRKGTTVQLNLPSRQARPESAAHPPKTTMPNAA